MWPSNKDIPLFVGVPIIMTHRVVFEQVAFLNCCTFLRWICVQAWFVVNGWNHIFRLSVQSMSDEPLLGTEAVLEVCTAEFNFSVYG